MATINRNYSPNPGKQEFYTLECNDHRVRIIVTATPSVVRRWVSSTLHLHRFQLRRGCLMVGLGVQWAPNHRDIPATLQLCVGHRCLVFQLQHADACPVLLRRFLSDTRITFVGVWNYRDEILLRSSHHRLQISHLLDLRLVADNLRGCGRNWSLEKLTENVLGWPGIVKQDHVGRSAWGQAWLSEEQVEYACVDAFLVFMIGKLLRAWKWSYESKNFSINCFNRGISSSSYSSS